MCFAKMSESLLLIVAFMAALVVAVFGVPDHSSSSIRRFDVDHTSKVGSKIDSLGYRSRIVSSAILNADYHPFGKAVDASDYFAVDELGNLLVARSLSSVKGSLMFLELESDDWTKLRTYEIHVTDEESTRHRLPANLELTGNNYKIQDPWGMDSIERSMIKEGDGRLVLYKPYDENPQNLQHSYQFDDVPVVFGRQHRSVRPIRVVKIPETKSDVLLNLESDYAERFSIKDPFPLSWKSTRCWGWSS